jgi:hypothetical protein
MLREVTKAVLATIRDTLRSRAALVAENTLLRQQVILDLGRREIGRVGVTSTRHAHHQEEVDMARRCLCQREY